MSNEQGTLAAPDHLEFASEFTSLTHYLFRFPAKFHVPVARTLIERFSTPAQTILDPFCGSGTLLVEARTMGRNAIGLDVDPLAIAVSRAKSTPVDPKRLHSSAAALLAALSEGRRTDDQYQTFKHNDLSDHTYARESEFLRDWIPPVPNLHHWFRRYVIIDLAWIRRAIDEITMPETHRRLFRVLFASIIRNASNADPVPVSGLEVTRWMLEREAAGRLVNPFALFEKAVSAALPALESLRSAVRPRTRGQAMVGDATQVEGFVASPVDAVITSPPYHGAVDYYRRHQLEMFWLGLTPTQADRLKLLQRYVGRPKVANSHPFSAEPLPTALAKEWEAKIREVSAERAQSFRHYLTAMTHVFIGLGRLLAAGAPAVFVVGHSSWQGGQIPTSDLFDEISGDAFRLEQVLQYPVKNRYMSYSRHNNADINTEYVLVLRRQ